MRHGSAAAGGGKTRCWQHPWRLDLNPSKGPVRGKAFSIMPPRTARERANTHPATRGDTLQAGWATVGAMSTVIRQPSSPYLAMANPHRTPPSLIAVTRAFAVEAEGHVSPNPRAPLPPARRHAASHEQKMQLALCQVAADQK